MSDPSPPAGRARVTGWAVLAVAALLTLHYFLTRLPAGDELWLGLEHRLRDLLVFAALVGGAWAVGTALLRRLAPTLERGAYAAAFAAGLGFLYHMTAVLLLAIVQWIRPWTLALVLAAPLSILWRERGALQETWRALASASFRPSAVRVIAVLATILYVAVALAPPSWTDALTYHLTIPKEYVEHGGVPSDTGNFFHNFPTAFSMLYLLLMGLGSDLVTQLFHLFFLLLTVVVARHHFRHLAPPWVVSCALLLFFCQWTNFHGAQRANVDFQFAFYGLAPLLVLVEVMAGEGTRPFERSWPLLCGLLAGAGIAGKIQAVTSLAAMLLILAVAALRRRVSARQLAVFAIAAGAVYLPTLVRNLVYSFDPFLLALTDRFGWTQGASAFDLERFRDLGSMKAVFMTRPGFWTFLLTPLFVYTDGAFPTTTFDAYLDPLYLVGLPLAALLLRRNRTLRWLALGLVGFYLAWFFTAPLTRYALPVMPIVALVSLAGFARLSEIAGGRSRTLLRRGFAGLVLAISSFNVLHFAAEAPYLVGYGLPGFLELISRRLFLERTGAIHGLLAGETIGRLEAAAGRTVRESRRGVFMILASECYYLPARYVNDPFYVNLGLLERRAAAGQDPVSWLREQGFGYVLLEPGRVGWLLRKHHVNPLLNPYPEGLAKLGASFEFFRRDLEPRLQPIERQGPLMLYAIPEAPGNNAASSAGRSG